MHAQPNWTPMNWSALPDLEEVPELSAADMQCLAEVKTVLERHGAVKRFAIHLIHKHFDLKENELLVETNDGDERTQTLKAYNRADLNMDDIRPTTWILDGETPEMACGCLKYQGSHTGRHDPTGYNIKS